MNTTLKAYLITMKHNEVTSSTVVIAYSKKEAGDLYVKWLKVIGKYNNTKIICIQAVRKTKRNKDFFKPSYYKNQCAIINSEYADYMAKEGN